MGYTPDNNPYIPGDPYSYDLKWQVDNIKHMQTRFAELDEQVQEATDQADRAEQEADRAVEEANRSRDEADRADSEALVSEGYAKGTQDGEAVTSGSPYFENNSKYYSEESAASAQASAGSASEAADYAAHIADPVSGLVTSWLAQHITQPTTPAIDTSLTVAGAAADAKAAGDALRKIGIAGENITAAYSNLYYNEGYAPVLADGVYSYAPTTGNGMISAAAYSSDQPHNILRIRYKAPGGGVNVFLFTGSSTPYKDLGYPPNANDFVTYDIPIEGAFENKRLVFTVQANKTFELYADAEILYTPFSETPTEKVVQLSLQMSAAEADIDSLETRADAIEENTGIISSQAISAGMAAECATLQQVPLSGLHFCGWRTVSNSDSNVLKTLRVYVPADGTYTFEVGTIDQNRLIVPTNIFNLSLTAGLNTVDMTRDRIPVKSGQILFMDMSSTDLVYFKNVVPLPGSYMQDDDHYISGDYEGYTVYNANYVIPFDYDLSELTVLERLDILETPDTENEQSNIIPFLVTPAGVKKHMLLDAGNNIVFGNWHPKKIKVVGNSLTCPTPATPNSNFGLCASNYQSDWFYHVYNRGIIPSEPGVVFDTKSGNEYMIRMSGTAWESKTSSADRQAWWDLINNPDNTNHFDSDLDLIIIQLGDNVNTPAKWATLPDDAKTLIQNIRTQCPAARIAWVSGWYTTDFKEQAIKAACEKYGAYYINISDMNIEANQGYIGMIRTLKDNTTTTISDAGSASHPGDLGMSLIASRIINILGL